MRKDPAGLEGGVQVTKLKVLSQQTNQKCWVGGRIVCHILRYLKHSFPQLPREHLTFLRYSLCVISKESNIFAAFEETAERKAEVVPAESLSSSPC